MFDWNDMGDWAYEDAMAEDATADPAEDWPEDLWDD